VFMWWLLTAE